MKKTIILSLGAVIAILLIVAAYFVERPEIGFELEKKSSSSTTTIVYTKSDTLYIHLDESYTTATEQPNYPNLRYRGDNDLQEVCILPVLKIEESDNDTLQKFTVEIKKILEFKDEVKFDHDMPLSYTTTDSLLTINPKWYNKGTASGRDSVSIEIHITTPKGKKVKTNYPKIINVS